MRGNMLGLEALGVPKLIDRLQVQGKAGYVILNQNGSSVQDSLVACKFANIAVADEYFARALSALTGITYPSGEMLRAGERIWTLERLYNLREGFTRADDTLLPRLRPNRPPATARARSATEPMLTNTIARRLDHECRVPKS